MEKKGEEGAQTKNSEGGEGGGGGGFRFSFFFLNGVSPAFKGPKNFFLWGAKHGAYPRAL